MVTRAGFLKRMALAAAACAFLDVVRPVLRWTEDAPWSLADAIANARSGDVIVVPPGEYEADMPLVVAASDLTIVGNGDSMIHVYHDGPLAMTEDKVENVLFTGLYWTRHV